MTQTIIYEYPLNERVRTLLRLEDLYDRLAYFAAQQESRQHEVALATLFEILDVAGRADIKSELLQELDRQKHQLGSLRANPAVSLSALDAALEQVTQSYRQLLNATGRFGQHLRDNEWLMAIKQRAALPGGICEFDAPAYHYWLHRDADDRRADLANWTAPLQPLGAALRLVLKLLRESAHPGAVVARGGAFQQAMAGKVGYMLRVSIADTLACVPEISANKFALSIRFMTPNTTQRPRQVEHDVAFTLTFCNV